MLADILSRFCKRVADIVVSSDDFMRRRAENACSVEHVTGRASATSSLYSNAALAEFLYHETIYLVPVDNLQRIDQNATL